MINITLTFEEIKTLYDNGFDVEIETPFNYSKVLDCYEKHSEGRTITFDDGSSFTGAKNHWIYAGREEFSPLYSLSVGDIIPKKDNSTKQIVNIQEVPEQRWIDFSIEESTECYIQSDIIHHNSGKSLILYAIARYLIDNNKIGLLIVPNVTLAHQLYNDFEDYSSLNEWDTEDNIHKIYSGQEKITDKKLTISTWQSLMNIKDKSLFERYDFVLIDEAHGIKSTEITKILEKCTNASYRIGLTGTTDNCKANINTIIGLTGEINKLNSTTELIDKGEISNFNIQCLVLKYDNDTSKLMKKAKYQDEINFLVSNKKRNTFIKNLALSTKSNTIVLFQYVEKHGKVLYDLIKASKHLDPERKVFFIHGGVEGEERERIRQLLEHETNAIVLASVQIMGTGTSIKNLHNIIFAINGKSSIRILQSIGRALRLHNSKQNATIYDIIDDLSYKSNKNHTLNHFIERAKLYNKEQFNYKLKKIDFNQN